MQIQELLKIAPPLNRLKYEYLQERPDIPLSTICQIVSFETG